LLRFPHSTFLCLGRHFAWSVFRQQYRITVSVQAAVQNHVPSLGTARTRDVISVRILATDRWSGYTKIGRDVTGLDVVYKPTPLFSLTL
jgi:hypothetical protein